MTSALPTKWHETTAIPDDSTLAAGIALGDEAACEMLVRQHGPRMLAVAKRFFPCPEDAADAVQDAFISAFRNIASFQGKARLTTWLHRIVVNASLMKLRARRADDTVSIEPLLPTFDHTAHHARPIHDFGAAGEDGLARAQTSETRQIVRACIDQLPEPYRTVLVLRDIEEMDTEATAKAMNCSIPNVKTRLHRARMALRTLLERRLAPDAQGN